MYKIVNDMPCAYFYYKGSHSHPIRRTILIIEDEASYIRGYELREGNVVRKLPNAPIKTYQRNRIAKGSQLGRNKHRMPGPHKSTLKRTTLLDLLNVGV